MPTKTEEALWTRLHAGGAVADAQPPAHAGTPWLIELLLGGSAWLASLFLMGFFGALFVGIWQSPPGLATLGAICCGIAIAVMRRAAHPFLHQLVLPVSLAGQFQLAAGLWQGLEREDDVAGAFITAVIAAVMGAAAPQALHRFLCSGIVLGAGYYILHELQLGPYATALFAAGCALVWAVARTHAVPATYAAVRPLGHALAPALLIAASLSGALPFAALFDTPDATAPIWTATPDAIALLVVFVAALACLLRERRIGITDHPLLLGGSVLIGIVLLPAPGALAALLLMLLAFAAGERTLLLFGWVSLLLYLGHYYYALQLTLLQKSVVLVASGAVLLVLRAVAARLSKEGAA